MISLVSALGIVVILILSISILQNKKPTILPKVLKNWKFLPLHLRSLEPYDAFVVKYLICCKKLKSSHESQSDIDESFVIHDPVFGELIENFNGKEIYTVSNLYHINKFELSK